ncbi:2,5-diamino-6-ribosylamino-4(3H)-pyrimidinone 5'-phosphate reductase [Smittium mucronatum]|uniref:2,5-diamino-6-ribosylamino-4(3H)-pyrimidinone 5'-phosphate reductase n=1 Tax=Smittium mucronatum TaxID=133383 RepID=A0A1R0H300_9FUNG|nr:2,5-diamino-6-ribosylamino-4(3H)-pyrimidinone 5'-phosphate reductase [Smittium mucronatum]
MDPDTVTRYLAKDFWSTVDKKFSSEPASETSTSEDRGYIYPKVTLTFAQTLDGKISASERKQLLISCKESMVLTHYLRNQHDGILVGVGTILNDNPSLNGN